MTIFANTLRTKHDKSVRCLTSNCHSTHLFCAAHGNTTNANATSCYNRIRVVPPLQQGKCRGRTEGSFLYTDTFRVSRIQSKSHVSQVPVVHPTRSLGEISSLLAGLSGEIELYTRKCHTNHLIVLCLRDRITRHFLMCRFDKILNDIILSRRCFCGLRDDRGR